MHSPITLYVGQDARDASTYIPYVSQSGLTLLDRDYYLRSDSPFATIRKQFRAYAARVLGLAGVADPDAAAGGTRAPGGADAWGAGLRWGTWRASQRQVTCAGARELAHVGRADRGKERR